VESDPRKKAGISLAESVPREKAGISLAEGAHEQLGHGKGLQFGREDVAAVIGEGAGS
jgi:hypothetical protein